MSESETQKKECYHCNAELKSGDKFCPLPFPKGRCAQICWPCCLILEEKYSCISSVKRRIELDLAIKNFQKEFQKEFLKILTSKGFLIYIGIIYGGIALCLCYNILKGFVE